MPQAFAAGLGRRVRAAGDHPDRQRRRAAAARPQPCEDGRMIDLDDRHRPRSAGEPAADRASAPRIRLRGRAAARGPPRSRRRQRPATARPRARPCSTSATCRSTTARTARSAWTTLKIYRHLVTAVIGPSGCGKSTFIRSLNRMNDSIPGFRIEGQVLYHGHDVYAAASTASRCAAGSGWCSRSRTRSRSRSTTTSPGRRATSG